MVIITVLFKSFTIFALTTSTSKLPILQIPGPLTRAMIAEKDAKDSERRKEVNKKKKEKLKVVLCILINVII